MSSRRTPWVLLLAALLALPVFFGGAAAHAAAPAVCDGMFDVDPAGDAEYDSNGLLSGGGKPGQPNMDITGLYFNYSAGADGKPALTMNTVLANLDKTLPPSSETGASGGIWYYGYYTFGGETRFVRGANRGGADFEYRYGYIIDGFFITEGSTTGSITEGPNGVVSVVIPEDVGGKPGDKLEGFIATVDTIEGEDDFIGINHQADWTELKEGEEDPDIVEPNGLDYTVTPCPAGSTAPPPSDGGGTTPPPSGGGGEAPTTAPAGPTFTELPFRPQKSALGSARKAKKRGLAFKAGANADITNLVVKLLKGKKTIASGKAATFEQGVRTFKLKKSRKLKKGKYTMLATGVVDGESLSVTHKVVVKK